MPILLVALVVIALSLYGFGTAWANLRAALGLAWDGVEFALLYAEYEARMFWRNYLLWFLVASAIFGAICFAVVAWGITREGTYLERALPVAIAGGAFGFLIAVLALFAQAIQQAIEAVTEFLTGLAWLAARFASLILSIFKIMDPLGARTKAVRDPMSLSYTEALFMPAVLLYFWDLGFLMAFPTKRMLAFLIVIDVFLFFGWLLARWLRKEPWLWKITYAGILPVLVGVVFIRSFFPRPVDLSLRSVERAYTYVECHMDGSSTADPVCKAMFVREALEDAEKLIRKGEKLAGRHTGGGAIATGPTPPPPPPIGFSPAPPTRSGGDADAPPEP